MLAMGNHQVLGEPVLDISWTDSCISSAPARCWRRRGPRSCLFSSWALSVDNKMREEYEDDFEPESEGEEEEA